MIVNAAVRVWAEAQAQAELAVGPPPGRYLPLTEAEHGVTRDSTAPYLFPKRFLYPAGPRSPISPIDHVDWAFFH